VVEKLTILFVSKETYSLVDNTGINAPRLVHKIEYDVIVGLELVGKVLPDWRDSSIRWRIPRGRTKAHKW
jgi:hypothetical protein